MLPLEPGPHLVRWEDLRVVVLGHLPDALEGADGLHRIEVEATHDHPFERLGYSDLSFYTRGQTKVEFLEGDTEVAKGVTVFDTPGHTISHVSLMVEPEDRRPMIFCGDACYTFETLERMIVGGFHLDPIESISALKRIKQMAKEYDAEIFPSHEMGPWLSWKHAPESYE